jgi:hypothetical protein
MRYWLILFLVSYVHSARADDLSDEIQSWKPGDEVPHRLLSYPDGAVEPQQISYSSTRDAVLAIYIAEIDNNALLEEIIFDRRSESSSFQHAFTRLVERNGMKFVAERLMTRESTRWEHETLRQLLLVPYVKLTVASISMDDMPREKALRVLGSLKSALDTGESWTVAYPTVADQNPATERDKREFGDTTVVRYLFDGWVSETGYVFSQLSANPYLPAKHLPRLFSSSKGGVIVEEPDEVYLYYVSDIYDPGPNTALERSVKGLEVGTAGAWESIAPAVPSAGLARPAQRGR